MQKHWGDSEYSVHLQLISTTSGSLEPAFSPDHTDYVVEVKDHLLEHCEVTLSLDMTKYFVDEPPKIKVDGKELNYSPVYGIRVPVLLNETWAIEDKVLQIEVIDPGTEGGASFFGHALKAPLVFTYQIHFYQEPDYRYIVKPLDLNVTDDFGKELVGDNKFDPDIDEYRYTIGESVEAVHINMVCPDIDGHTKQLHDDKVVSPDKPYTLDLSNSFISRATVACQYEDERYINKKPKVNEYNFIFERHVKERGVLKAQLMMVANRGYCEQVDPKDAMLSGWKGNASDVDRGFVCRVDSHEARVVPALTDSSLAAQLTKQPTGEVHLLHTGLESTISMTRGRYFYTFRVQAGDARADYPVVFVWVAPCTDLSIPSGKARRIADPNRAKTHMCLQEKCSPSADKDVCFVNAARCSTYSLGCKGNDTLRVDAKSISCKEAVCSIENDQDTCCGDAVATPFNAGDQVWYKHHKADVYDIDKSSGVATYNLVVEHDHKMPSKVPAKELRRIHPQTYLKGEEVIVDGLKAHIWTHNHTTHTYNVKFQDGTHAHHINATKIQKVPFFFFPAFDTLGKDILESRPGDILYEVSFEDGSRDHTVPPGDIMLLHQDVGMFRVGDEVMAEQRRAVVTEVGINKFHVKFKKALRFVDLHHKSGWFDAEQMVLVEAGFFPGDFVYYHGRQARVEARCGQAKWCHLIYQDSSPSGAVPAADLIRKHGFSTGEEVVVHGRKGIIADHCVGAQRCHVNFVEDGVKRRSGSYHISDVRREVGFVQDEMVVVKGRRAKIETTCLCNTQTSTCQATFDDNGKSTGQLRCDKFIKQGGFSIGEVVMVNGHQGTIVARRPKAQYWIEYLNDIQWPYAEGENSGKESGGYTRGEELNVVNPAGRPHSSAEHVWNFVGSPGGAPVGTQDLGIATVEVGSRVVVGGRSAIVKSISDNKYKVIFQYNGEESGHLERDQLNTEMARVMIGDRVSAFGHKGTVKSVSRSYGRSFEVQFDRTGERSGQLWITELKLIDHEFKKGDEVLVKGKPAVVGVYDEALQAYSVTHDGNKKSFPWKSFQLQPKSTYTEMGTEFEKGDEVIVYGVEGVVRSGPDEKGMFKITFFRDGLTAYPLPRAALKTPDQANEGETADPHEYPLPEFQMKHATVGFRIGDKVMYNKDLGVVTDGPNEKKEYPVQFMDAELNSRSIPADELKLRSPPTTTRLHVGDEVIHNGKKAIVVLGPTTKGRFMIRYEDGGDTGGPFPESAFKGMGYQLGEEVLARGQKAVVTMDFKNGTYLVHFEDSGETKTLRAEHLRSVVNLHRLGNMVEMQEPWWMSRFTQPTSFYGVLVAAIMLSGLGCFLLRPGGRVGSRELCSSRGLGHLAPEMTEVVHRETERESTTDSRSDSLRGLLQAEEAHHGQWDRRPEPRRLRP